MAFVREAMSAGSLIARATGVKQTHLHFFEGELTPDLIIGSPFL